MRSDGTDTRRLGGGFVVNKAELIEAMHERAGLSKTDAENALNAFIETVQGAVASGDKVALPGFGTYAPTLRKARTARNPRTGEPINIPEQKSAKFTVGSKFKAQVQGR
jgi:DNA-binding protein HU-beta